MSRKKRRNESPPPRAKSKLPLALAFVALGVSGLLAARWWQAEPVELPEVDLASMEPQVAEKIEARGEAVRESPRSPDTWGELGEVYQAHSLHAAAAVAYERAIALTPGEFRWHYLLVHALRGVDVAEAVAQAERAATVESGYAPLYVVHAELLEELGEPDRALELYERAVSLDPENAMAAFGLGRLLLARGDTEEAIEWLEKARELSSEAGAIHAMLARAYQRIGDREKAEAEARLAFEKKEPVGIADPIHYEMRQESVASTTLLSRAMSADDAGDHARAEAIYRSLVELRPDDPDMRARFGDVLARQDERVEAEAQYRAALELLPEHASASYGLATMLNLRGDYDGAERYYRAALEQRADHPPTLLNLGSLLVFKERPEEAEELFRRCLEIEPESAGCHRQLGTLLLRTERPGEAVDHLETALEAQPEEGALQASLAFALAQTGRIEEAREHAERAQSLGVQLPPAFLQALSSR